MFLRHRIIESRLDMMMSFLKEGRDFTVADTFLALSMIAHANPTSLAVCRGPFSPSHDYFVFQHPFPTRSSRSITQFHKGADGTRGHGARHWQGRSGAVTHNFKHVMVARATVMKRGPSFS